MLEFNTIFLLEFESSIEKQRALTILRPIFPTELEGQSGTSCPYISFDHGEDAQAAAQYLKDWKRKYEHNEEKLLNEIWSGEHEDRKEDGTWS
jgi:hypothetical protein